MERRRNAYGECDVPRVKNVISAVILIISFHPLHIFVPESNMFFCIHVRTAWKGNTYGVLQLKH